jgi:hypothetical protein
MPRSPARNAAVLLLAAALAAALSQLWLDARQLERCAFDGARIQPAFAVDWQGDAERLRFCTIECAARWRRLRPPHEGPEHFVVRDEATSEPVAAELAFFVRTPGQPAGRSHNFTRAFRRWQDALECRDALHGQITENPLTR